MRLRDLSILEAVMIGAVALLLPMTAQADEIVANWTCTFTAECFEQEACAESGYEVSISYDISELDGQPGHGAGSAEIIDVSATRNAIVSHDNGAFVATAVNSETETTISEEIFQVFATGEGDARLISAIPSVPLVITYHGTCLAEGS